MFVSQGFAAGPRPSSRSVASSSVIQHRVRALNAVAFSLGLETRLPDRPATPDRHGLAAGGVSAGFTYVMANGPIAWTCTTVRPCAVA